MPAESSRELVAALTDAVEASGYSALLLNRSLREHPRRFLVTSLDGEKVSVWIYAWTLTPGGRPSLPNEYRIQMTTVTSPLPLNPDGPTGLIGYEPDLRMFAGFDLSRHCTFTTGSPSVQIDIRTVREALQHGLAFDRKSNDEIAVAIRPDQFMDYIANAAELHRFGRFPDTFNLLTRASSLVQISDEDVSHLSQPRRRIVETVCRLSRKSNFRQQVLNAYGNRCAVTRVQLRLVDAAHVLPVGAPDSSDDVRNGIALAPTYHRAYDNGLIFLDDDYNMKINAAKETDLRALNLDGGLQTFTSHLGRVNLPPDRRQWPNLSLIRKANAFRRIEV